MKNQIVKTGLVACFLSLVSLSVTATNWAEGEELSRLIKHLDVAKNIIAKAKFESDKENRVQFDYAELNKDIELIKKGIKTHMDKPMQPRTFEAIKNNFSKYESSGH